MQFDAEPLAPRRDARTLSLLQFERSAPTSSAAGRRCLGAQRRGQKDIWLDSSKPDTSTRDKTRTTSFDQAQNWRSLHLGALGFVQPISRGITELVHVQLCRERGRSVTSAAIEPKHACRQHEAESRNREVNSINPVNGRNARAGNYNAGWVRTEGVSFQCG
jgi:hypothetical protein